MGYHRNFGCNTGCCDEQEALASVTRTGTVLNFADTSGKQTAIDLSEILPDPNRLVSAARSGTKLNFTDNKGNITTLDLADLIPSFDGVTDVAATTLGIRVTMSNGQTKDIDLSQIYTAPVAFNDVSRNGNTLTFTDTNGGQHSVELEAPPVALRDVSRSGTTLTFTDTNGGQHTVELDATPEVPVAYKGAMLNGSTLRFTDTAGATHDVDLASLIPASKADRFLSNVQYDPAAKKLTFTTSATGEADSTFEVNIADLLPVTVGDGLTGNGTVSSPVKVNADALKGSGIKVVDNKFTVDYDTTTMEMTEDGKLRPKASGLDCATIAALPKAAWKPETSILVNQDGECKRLVPNENIFTDVVVALAASKQNVELPKNQSETVDIIATVTNAGANPTGEVLVTLTKPQLGTYQLGTPTTNNIGETKTGELTWKIPAMASGKSLVITLPVTFSKIGSFSFGLQATSTIDTNKQNNTKTMTFTVTERIVNDGTNTNYIPTGTDCPLIIATDLTHNQRLNVYTTGTGENFDAFGKYINVFADGRGFAGKQIKLEGASTVVVTSAYADYGNVTIASRSSSSYIHSNSVTDYINGRYTGSNLQHDKRSSSSYSPSQALVIADVGFMHGKSFVSDRSNGSPSYLKDMGTFDPQTQIFTFRSDLKLPTRETSYDEAPYHCVIWCRPAGKDCKWQGVPIVLGIKDNVEFAHRYIFTKVKGNVLNETSVNLPPDILVEPTAIKAANFVGGEKPNDLMATRGGLSSAENEVASRHIVTVVSGQEAQFTLRTNGVVSNVSDYLATGKVSTSYDKSTRTLTVTVAADATPTDSIYWTDLKIIVK